MSGPVVGEQCKVTHRQIDVGICPWCNNHIGQFHEDQPAVLWKTERLVAAIKSGCIVTAQNIAFWVEPVLTYLAPYQYALRHPDESIRNLATDGLVRGATGLSDLHIASIAQNENDLASRILLLAGLSGSDNSLRNKQVLWIIQNYPQSEICATPFIYVDHSLHEKAFNEGRNQWLRILGDKGLSHSVLRNAAWFVQFGDPQLCESICIRGKQEYPALAVWSQHLARVYTIKRQNSEGDERMRLTNDIIAELEEALDLTTENTERTMLLCKLSLETVDLGEVRRASKYATDALALTNQGEWPYVVHSANIVLGRIDLARGDLPSAEKHLIASSSIGGSSRLASFTPIMTLARELLKTGRVEAVVRFLEGLSLTWHDIGHKCEQWIQEIRQGESPSFEYNSPQGRKRARE